jgi:hypothetical protein
MRRSRSLIRFSKAVENLSHATGVESTVDLFEEQR